MKKKSLVPFFQKRFSWLHEQISQKHYKDNHNCSGEVMNKEVHLITEMELREHNRLASQSNIEKFCR